MTCPATGESRLSPWRKGANPAQQFAPAGFVGLELLRLDDFGFALGLNAGDLFATSVILYCGAKTAQCLGAYPMTQTSSNGILWGNAPFLGLSKG
jgi:hypothetical protein